MRLFKPRPFNSDGRRATAAQHLQHDAVVAVVVTVVAAVVIVVVVIATLFGKRYRRQAEVMPTKLVAAAAVARTSTDTRV
jgi:heme/copper-type cytochrome/quinol oxidase subunit 2